MCAIPQVSGIELCDEETTVIPGRCSDGSKHTQDNHHIYLRVSDIESKY